MAMSYRAVLYADGPQAVEVDGWFRRIYPEESASLAHTKVDIDGVKGERWSIVWGGVHNRLDVTLLSGERYLLIVDRQHPLDVDGQTGGELASVTSLLEGVGGRIGPFHIGRNISADEIVNWLDDPLAADAQLAITVLEPTGMAGRLALELERQLAGLAAFGTVDLECAEVIQSYGRLATSRVREGSLVYAGKYRGAVEIETLPSTVVAMQPKQAVNRIRRRCLRRAAAFRFSTAEDMALLELARAPAGSSIDADALLNQLLLVEADLRQLRDEREIALLEQDEALTELNALRSKVRWLELRLREVNEYAIPDMADEEIVPDSCADAVDFAREMLPHLFICDITEGISRLDSHEKSLVWSKKIWLAMRALDDYAAAKLDGRHSGNFLSYCTDPPTAAIPYFAQSVALSESESTESDPHTRAIRTFPVPDRVHSSGHIYMGAHVKIDAKGAPAPRLHYYDDTSPNGSHLVCIGYIGPHLPTAGS